MPESAITIGSMILAFFFTLFIMGILSPIALAVGVFNGAVNYTNPAGQYLIAVFGNTGIEPFLNTSVNTNLLPYASSSSNATLAATSSSSLAATSGFAFISGGFTIFGKLLYNFPRFLWVMFTETFAYGGLLKFLPFDIFGLLSTIMLVYISIIIILKITSITSKPGGSVENI